MKNLLDAVLILLLPVAGIRAQGSGQAATVATINGPVQGMVEASGVHSFKGIPYAAPPVGDLRFREPQPVVSWQGVRKAQAFGPRAMQLPIYSDMKFRSDGVSEDCLYLNVWTPARKEAIYLCWSTSMAAGLSPGMEVSTGMTARVWRNGGS